MFPTYLLIITGFSLLHHKECYTNMNPYIVHVEFQNLHIWITENSMFSHLPSWPFGISFIYALQNKIKVVSVPTWLWYPVCTSNLTLTSFYALILLIKWWELEKTHLILVFFPCCYGFSYPDTGLTQIPWCWVATTSPGANQTSIPFYSLAYWNTWPFIIENELISIWGQLKITMHLSCQNPKLSCL